MKSLLFAFILFNSLFALASTQIVCSSSGFLGQSVQNFVFEPNLEDASTLQVQIIFNSYLGGAPNVSPWQKFEISGKTESLKYLVSEIGSIEFYQPKPEAPIWGVWMSPRSQGKGLIVENCKIQ